MVWTILPATERLRVAMISTPWVAVPPPRYGGTELVVSELVNGLVQRGHEVVLFATGDSRAPCQVRWRYPTPVWPPDPWTELAHAAWAVEEILSSPHPFDVVHSHVPASLGFARFLAEVPVVYTLHHDRDERLARLYAASGDDVHFVAISRRQASLFPELRTRAVIHHGLAPEAYPFGPRGRGYLAFLGRFARVKGPDIAIEVAGRLGRTLYMGGRPHDEGDGFHLYIEKMLSRPHVRALGELSHGPKVELLQGADALLFPIRWEEPFGLVMIEAMFCGCPVVAFRGGAVEEVVEDGVTGFLADDPEHMAALVREAVPRLDRRVVRARAVERFSSARMVDEHVLLYAAAIGERRAPRAEAASR